MIDASCLSMKRCLDLGLMASMAALFLVPHLVFVAFGTSSLAAGLMVASLLILLFNTHDLLNFRFSAFVYLSFVVFVFLLLHSIYDFYIAGESKPILSLTLAFSVLSAMCLGSKIARVRYVRLETTMFVFIALLLALGWLKLNWVPDFFGYSVLEKPVFPFSEESHYALAAGFLSCGYAYVAPPGRSLFVVINLLALSVFFPNLTLLVFSLVAFFLFSMRFQPLAFWGVMLSVMVVLVVLGVVFRDQLDYFTSRLSFSETENLTTLVFLQGWGLAVVNFIETYGMGLGFQMLGEAGTQYPSYTEKIVMLTGREFNTEDGGFLAAKLIAELGIVALFLLFLYLLFLLFFTLKGNYMHRRLVVMIQEGRKTPNMEKKNMMLLAFGFAFFVEVFLRGYGYFSPGALWALAALFAMSQVHGRRQYDSQA